MNNISKSTKTKLNIFTIVMLVSVIGFYTLFPSFTEWSVVIGLGLASIYFLLNQKKLFVNDRLSKLSFMLASGIYLISALGSTHFAEVNGVSQVDFMLEAIIGIAVGLVAMATFIKHREKTNHSLITFQIFCLVSLIGLLTTDNWFAFYIEKWLIVEAIIILAYVNFNAQIPFLKEIYQRIESFAVMIQLRDKY